MAWKNVSDLSIEGANDANVPVDIWIKQVTKDNKDEYLYVQVGSWVLNASNYMPRRARLSEGGDGYLVEADTREELVELLKKHVLPLYKNALAKLEGMITGTCTHLYYWDEKLD